MAFRFLTIRRAELNMTAISTEATLIGKTFADREITGTDSVKIISTEDKSAEISRMIIAIRFKIRCDPPTRPGIYRFV